MRRKKVLVAIGTRPEAIKMAPVVLALKEAGWADVRVMATAQHRHMMDQVLDVFGIRPDVDLDIMRPNQTLPELTSRLITALDAVLAAEEPDVVLVQGDTTTVLTVALASFYRKVPVGHVEAGLRTGDMQNPFPEEMNRVLAGNLCRWHFAPTQASRDNLLREGFAGKDVHVTGNTVIDALHRVAASELELGIALPAGKRLVLMTAHRRENFGAPFDQVCRAVRDLLRARDDIQVLYPVHPNPNVRDVARRMLGDCPGATLCDPLEYLPFVAAMKQAHFVLTDSGGVQEEAPALGKPVLVLRNETERPEAVAEGVVKLVGTDYDTILRESHRLLDDADAYREMAKGVSPYGDGHAAGRIVEILRRDLGA
jgi:UDP-N-acetylglucosamine 2-epimerase (non-hydrolysing)